MLPALATAHCVRLAVLAYPVLCVRPKEGVVSQILCVSWILLYLLNGSWVVFSIQLDCRLPAVLDHGSDFCSILAQGSFYQVMSVSTSENVTPDFCPSTDRGSEVRQGNWSVGEDDELGFGYI